LSIFAALITNFLVLLSERLVQDDKKQSASATRFKALREYDSNNADFCDTLIDQINKKNGCEHCVTFDKKAAKLPGFDLLV